MDSSHLKAYMREKYTVDNTVISIAGNYDDNILELLEKHFGDFGSGERRTLWLRLIFRGNEVPS